jgi:hypothetical protein
MTRQEIEHQLLDDRVIGGSRQLSTMPNPLVLGMDIISCQKLKILCSKKLLAVIESYFLAITFERQG